MSPRWKTWTMGLVLISLLLGACQRPKEEAGTEDKGGAPIAGTYKCTSPNDPNPPTDPTTGKPAVDVWELREDGTVKQTAPTRVNAKGETIEGETFEGTWSAKGDSGRVKSEFGAPPFKIEGDRLVFEGGDYVCTKP